MEVIMESTIMTKRTESNNIKKIYEKPQINRIKLVANEAVLALCKFGEGVGGRGRCTPDLSCVSTPRS
jgi:hypothetical protein